MTTAKEDDMTTVYHYTCSECGRDLCSRYLASIYRCEARYLAAWLAAVATCDGHVDTLCSH